MARDPSKKPENLAGTVSSSQLAEVFSCTTRMVEKYAEQNIVVKVARGRYHFMQSVKNLVAHLRKQAALQLSADGKNDQVSENILFKKTQRQLAETRLRQMEGNLISIEEIEEAWSALVAANRQLVLSIPTRCRLELPHMTGYDQKIILGICRDALTETALGEGHMPKIKSKAVDA